MRAIDAEKAIEIIEAKQKELCPVGRYGRNYVYGTDRERYDAWEEIIDALENIPTLTPPSEPLTFVERREMDRKPVWLDDEKTFGILQFWDDNNVDAVFLDPSGCIRVKSVIGKKIYRRPPEGEA